MNILVTNASRFVLLSVINNGFKKDWFIIKNPPTLREDFILESFTGYFLNKTLFYPVFYFGKKKLNHISIPGGQTS